MKTGLITLLCLILPLIGYAATYEEVIYKADELDHQARHQEMLDILLEYHTANPPELKVIWRIGIAIFEVANKKETKNEKIAMFEKGENLLKPYIDIDYGSERDRVEIIHWYMVNYASRLKIKGIFAGREGLTIVPKVFTMMDKCIEIDPAYYSAYYFKAKLHEEIPFIIGGDKFEMGYYYSKALHYAVDRVKILIMIDAANGFVIRNWSAQKKQKEARKRDKYTDDGTPTGLSDKEYALQLINQATALFEAHDNPGVRDREKYEFAQQLKLKIMGR